MNKKDVLSMLVSNSCMWIKIRFMIKSQLLGQLILSNSQTDLGQVLWEPMRTAYLNQVNFGVKINPGQVLGWTGVSGSANPKGNFWPLNWSWSYHMNLGPPLICYIYTVVLLNYMKNFVYISPAWVLLVV